MNNKLRKQSVVSGYLNAPAYASRMSIAPSMQSNKNNNHKQSRDMRRVTLLTNVEKQKCIQDDIMGHNALNKRLLSNEKT